jgi:hypothetical protein
MSGTEIRQAGYALEIGTPDLRSAGPLAFGPGGIVFVADNAGAAIFALDVARADAPAGGAVEDLDGRLAAYLGCAREDVQIRDLAAHPDTGEVWLSVTRAGAPLLMTVGPDGDVADVPLRDVPFARAAIDDAPSAEDAREDIRVVAPGEPATEEREIHGITLRLAREPLRTTTVTDLAYVDGALLVAGASNEEFVSTLRRIPFPFGAPAERSSLEIFHVSHGKYETHSPIRTFVPYDGGASILAAYTCTPVVRFSVGTLGATQARGRTVAELGAMNTPLDMVAYRRDGEEYLLVANSRHPLLRLRCADLDAQEALTTPREPKGPPREALPHAGVTKLAAVDGHVLMLQRDDAGLHLRAYDTASL